MLNGKFFTGLPPKMIERGGGPVKNRLESHFFWPDDTRAESAAEGRVRRRNSLQSGPERPTTVQRQASFSPGGGREEVDTKRMFHKEFAKSSIQFFDHIEEQPGDDARSRRDPPRRQEIAPKPTATKPPPPRPEPEHDDEVAPGWPQKQKQQAFASKIEFYDYVDEDQNRTRRNNERPPRLDMNDKRTVERNTKNSPKLQVKRDVRSLRDEAPGGLKVRNDQVGPWPPSRPTRRSQDPVEHYVKVEVDREPEFEPELEREPEPEPEPRVRRGRDSTPGPARRSAMRREPVVDHGVRVRPGSASKKHVTYEDERYAAEPLAHGREVEGDGRPRWSLDDSQPDFDYYDQQPSARSARPGGDRRRPVRGSPDFADFGEGEEPHRYVESRPGRAGPTKTTIKNNIYRPNNITNHTQSQGNKKPNNSNHSARSNNNQYTYNNSNQYSNNDSQYVERKISPKVSTTTTMAMVESSGEPSADAQKHLRSNICFNGSAATAVPADSGATPPTAQARRNARSSAAAQRVSVGLPD